MDLQDGIEEGIRLAYDDFLNNPVRAERCRYRFGDGIIISEDRMRIRHETCYSPEQFRQVKIQLSSATYQCVPYEKNTAGLPSGRDA